MPKSAWACILPVLIVSVLAGCESPTQPMAQAKSRPDDFEKKSKCAALLDKLRDDSEHDRFKQEAYIRTFYSPRLNACLSEKYTLFGDDEKIPESMEIDDLSSNKTVWSSTVTCKVRDVGMADPPRREYGCSDYYWNVQKQIEDYVKANGLEDEEKSP
jgi:hypothetical protein